MPRRQGVWRQEWDRCDRCGFLHPIGMLSMQFGFKVCKCHGCYDYVQNEYRAKAIAETLADGGEGMSDKPQIFSDPQELKF